MKKENNATENQLPSKKKFRIPYQNIIVGVAAFAYFFTLQTSQVLATDMWSKADTILKDVYGKILGISTIAAIVTASVALLLMNFSKSGRTVDESRAWLKRIAISWVILNGLGFILAYVTPFHRACSNIGGEFIQISPASRNCINIMEIRKVDSSASDILDGPQTEKSELAAKIQRLHIFFSLLIPDMTHEERQLLDEALIQTYNQKGITHNNESLPDPEDPEHYREMPVLEDVFNILKKNADTKRLANIMNRLVHGSASTFNQQTNVNLDNKYTVLDISELTGDLLTVGMFVALDYVWDKAKEDRTVEKAIFIDETWQLIGAASNRLAAEFVLEIFKIIRGYGGSAICDTQDLNDFFALEDGKYGKGIINNSKTKIVLNLEDEEAMRVQSILHLSEAETMAVTHFERGNGLISTNNNNVTVEFKASELEKELITTDRNELKKLLEKERQRRQMAEAV